MTYEQIVNAPTAASVRALLDSGLTVRDVAELMRADPRAIEALAHARKHSQESPFTRKTEASCPQT